MEKVNGERLSRDSYESFISISSEESVQIEEQTQTTPEQISQVSRNLLRQLDTSLSPKFTEIERCDGRVSRYGRHQKSKSLEDGFIPTDVARFVSKSGSKGYKTITFDSLRIIKTPTKVFPENEVVVNNNNESSAKVFEDAEKVTEVCVDLTKDGDTTASLLDDKEQLSDVESGRGSSIDSEYAALMNKYQEGSIYWAEYKGGYWWPCLVAPDPDGQLFRANPKGFDIHVKYFADQRSWILAKKLLPYKSFEELKAEHKIDMRVTKMKMFLRSVVLANDFMNIPVEQRVALYDAEEQNERKKRKSKEVVPLPLNRSLTPESPAYEDITGDKETVKSDLKIIRESTLKTYRKRKLSINTTVTEIHPKRSRYSQRMVEIRNKPPPEPKLSLSAPVKIKKTKDEKNLDYDVVPSTEQLRDEYMTKDFHYTHLYPEHSIIKEYVCRLCYRPKKLKHCRGCNGYFHELCVAKAKYGQPLPVLERIPIGRQKRSRKSVVQVEVKKEVQEITVDAKEPESTEINFFCFDCEAGTNKKCFICKVKAEDDIMVVCSFKGCLRSYHKGCIVKFPQTTVSANDQIVCAYHKCHACFASNNDSITPESSLIMCVMCPTSYHYNDVNCIPAGTEWLTSKEIICQNHALKSSKYKPANVDWCFVCARPVDTLICCEMCPGSYHLSCVKEDEVPQGKYTCDNCLAGHRPLYNQIVWAKMGVYRYWPAIILPPRVVPLSMLNRFHYPSDFCVKFFGTRDCYWLGRHRVFVYEEDDKMGKFGPKDKALEKAFSKAMQEAKIVYKMLQEEKTEIQRSRITHKARPDPYVRLRANKAVPPIKLEMDIDQAEMVNFECICKPTDPDPCGYTSHCLNRSVKQECDPTTCPAKEMCQNQSFIKRQYPQLKEKHTSSKGWGLFAQEDIEVGAFVIEYVGEVITVDEMERRMEFYRAKSQPNYYFMNLKQGQIVDAGAKGNLARFINHSCMPNCQTEQWQVGRTVRNGIFALKNIKKDEELTFDYQLICKGDVQTTCFCGTAECRGSIGPKRRASANSGQSIKPTKLKLQNRKRKRKLSICIENPKKKHKKEKTQPINIQESLLVPTPAATIIDDDLEIKSENFVSVDNDSTYGDTKL